MKRIYDIIISVTAAASALCISACAEKELLPGTVEEGIPVEATLTFGAPNSDDVTVTTKAELNDYSDITSLYLFIYNSVGTCEDVIPVAEDQISGGQIVGTGRQYSTTIRTTTGTKRIFAVANYVSVESWVDFRNKIETLGSRAKDGKLTMDEVGKEIVYLRDTYINNGTTPEYPTQQMIFTSRTGGDIVTFNNKGSSSGVINLERIAANVIFNIRSGSRANGRISFIPTSYQIYNLPKGTRLAGGKADLWNLRRTERILSLPFRKGLSRNDKDNVIEQYLSDAPEIDVVDSWQDYFSEKPHRMSREEKAELIASVHGIALASDAFFPFSDNIDRAARSGVDAIAQPGGSVSDDLVIGRADEYGMVMCFTGIRLFHH